MLVRIDQLQATPTESDFWSRREAGAATRQMTDAVKDTLSKLETMVKDTLMDTICISTESRAREL